MVCHDISNSLNRITNVIELVVYGIVLPHLMLLASGIDTNMLSKRQ
jgi:hypothetical protein